MKKQHTILIIEDEPLLLDAIGTKLEKSGFKTIKAQSGEQALELLSDAKNLPAAIWLDYHLKSMNGLQFMSEIKKDKALSTVPVFVVSNSAADSKVKNMLALGAKKYFLKAEYRLEEIIKIIGMYAEKSLDH